MTTSTDPATNPTDTLSFARWLSTYAPGARVTANDAADWCEAAQVSPRRLGGLFRGAREAGKLRAVGYTTATHEAAKRHVIRVWEIQPPRPGEEA